MHTDPSRPSPVGASVLVRGLEVHLPALRHRARSERPILRDVSFTAPRGRVTALVGTNGAGKTTVLRSLSGALRPTSGSIQVLGTPIGGPEDALPPGVGVVPDAPFQPDHWSADELVLTHRRVEPRLDAHRVGRLLRRAGIAPAAQLRQLSAGQRSRLLLAVALGIQPSLLLLDEPLARLDPLAREDVLEELRDHQAGSEDRTIVMSSHDLGDLERFVDHIVLLHEGRVVLEGSALDLAEEHLIATTSAAGPAGPRATTLRGARRSGDRLEGLVRAEDAVALEGLSDLRRPTLRDVLTFTLREVSR